MRTTQVYHPEDAILKCSLTIRCFTTHTPFHPSFARSRNFGRFDPPKLNIYIVVRRASEITSRPSDSRLGGLEMRFGDRFRSDRERTPDSGEYFLEWGGVTSPVCLSMQIYCSHSWGGGSNLFSNSNPNLSMKARQTYPDNPIITGWGSSISLTWNVLASCTEYILRAI
jgi:hypothetical protein